MIQQNEKEKVDDLLYEITELKLNLRLAEEEITIRRGNMENTMEKQTEVMESVNNYKEMEGKKNIRIAELETDIISYETSMKNYENNEKELKLLVYKKDMELVEQQEKFEAVGNPEYDILVKFETSLKTQLGQIESTLKESLLKVVSENNKKMEEKVNEAIGQNIWCDKGGTNGRESSSIAYPMPLVPKPIDFRLILNETKNEQLNEANDQKVRACNIIIHGVTEDPQPETMGSKKEQDERYVQTLFSCMSVTRNFRSVHRIGKPETGKNRPIKVIMNNEEDKNVIMRNLTNLKNQADYKGVSIAEDYTITERQMIKEWSSKAKDKNDEEGPNSKNVWRVRGSPKNGLRLKKFLKR